jgi:apoptosis-inducing factor 3
MPETFAMHVKSLPQGSKKCVKIGDAEILLIHLEIGIAAVESKCPHAGAELIEGAVCNGRLVCPWHMATFELPTGRLIEPPAMKSLKTYSARIDGDRIMVDSEDRSDIAPDVPTHGKPRFLIVGAGAAGSMAVSTLGERGFSGEIVIVDPVADEPVDRTQLSKDALGGKVPLDQVPLDVGYKTDRILASVTMLNSADRSAQLSDGRTIQFDRALIATGGIPNRLEIPGAAMAYTIRHTDDIRKILKAAASATDVVIIGTSFIALEAASALVQTGLRVTVAGVETAPFAKIVGEKVANGLLSLHEHGGTQFRLGVEIRSISERGVTVSKNGQEELLPAQLAIFGVGVKPALEFEHDLVLASEGGGIAVDTSMRATENIWVAGDIANLNGTRIEHWRVAQQHGQVSALAMMGEESNYHGVPFFWTYHFGKRLACLGSSKDWDEIVLDGDLTEMEFLAFYVSGQGAERVVEAVLGCGRDGDMAKLAEPMRSRLTLDAARSALL